MIIHKVEYKKVYGFLSGEISLTNGENFLVGINGCGKTTVLNLIRWVLEPCFPELCTLQHDLIKVDVKHEGYIYSIQSRILDGFHELKIVTRNKKRKFNSINTPLAIAPSRLSDASKDLKSQYEHLAPEPKEIVTFEFLFNELPSPVFIGLKRSIEGNQPARALRRGSMFVKGTNHSSPYDIANTLMRDAFNTGRRKLVEINDELNRKVMELSFSGVIRGGFKVDTNSATIAKKIAQLKSKFEDSSRKEAYSKTLSATEVRDAVVKYLDELSNILNSKNKDDVFIMLNQHNFERAAKMFDLFEKHESDAYEVQLEINNFINAVNRFIGDSNKSLHFDDDTGIPYFESVSNSKKLRLTELSSGEAQVVVLLSYFAFYAKQGISIIIDEPELSLHVQWQKYFVSAVKEVMPDECQTIMATHSPEICGADDVNVQSVRVQEKNDS